MKLLYLIIASLIYASVAFATGYDWDATTTNYVITNTTAFDSPAFTICIDVTRDGDGEAGTAYMLSTSEATPGWRLWIFDGTSYEFRAVRTGSVNGIWRWTKPSTGTPINTCIAYDATSTTNDPVIYENASPVTFTTDSNAASGDFSSVTGVLRIGNNSASATRTWDGQMSNLCLWERVLSAGEIKQQLNCGCPSVKGLSIYMPLGLFGPRNYTANAFSVTETALTVTSVGTLPQRRIAQGAMCE